MPNAIFLPISTRVPVLEAVVDGYPDAEHGLSTRTGRIPLEDGRSATDHSVAEPKEIMLTGRVTNFGESSPQAAWDELISLQESGEAFEVITSLRTYPQVLIKRARGRQIGLGLRFTLELEEVLYVGVPPPVPIPEGPADGRGDGVDRGRVSTEYLESQVQFLGPEGLVGAPYGDPFLGSLPNAISAGLGYVGEYQIPTSAIQGIRGKRQSVTAWGAIGAAMAGYTPENPPVRDRQDPSGVLPGRRLRAGDIGLTRAPTSVREQFERSVSRNPVNPLPIPDNYTPRTTIQFPEIIRTEGRPALGIPPMLTLREATEITGFTQVQTQRFGRQTSR